MKNLGCLIYSSRKYGNSNLTKFKNDSEKKPYLTILYLIVINHYLLISQTANHLHSYQIYLSIIYYL